MRQSSRTLWFAVGLICLLLSGCYKETVTEDSMTVSYAWWVTLTALVVGAAAVFAGWAIREDENLERLAWSLMGGGALAILVFVPITFRNKVTVDAQHFASATGFWFFGTSHNVKFGEIHRMELHSIHGRRGTRFYLLCFDRRGGKFEVPVSDLMKPAMPRIVATATVNQVEFIDKQ